LHLSSAICFIMCSLFRNKYRVESSRLICHDYSSCGKYFITICTNGKIHWFGNILNHEMILSEPGQIAKKLWHKLPEHFPFISLDEFVIMPDHIHGIIIINPNMDAVAVQTLHATSVRPRIQSAGNTKNNFMASISPKPGSLATIIRSYKSAVSKNIHLIIPDFSWHSRYYDHIIRSNPELERIRKYIINNPANWLDEFSR
jgi:putative transposase